MRTSSRLIQAIDQPSFRTTMIRPVSNSRPLPNGHLRKYLSNSRSSRSPTDLNLSSPVAAIGGAIGAPVDSAPATTPPAVPGSAAEVTPMMSILRYAFPRFFRPAATLEDTSKVPRVREETAAHVANDAIDEEPWELIDPKEVGERLDDWVMVTKKRRRRRRASREGGASQAQEPEVSEQAGS